MSTPCNSRVPLASKVKNGRDGTNSSEGVKRQCGLVGVEAGDSNWKLKSNHANDSYYYRKLNRCSCGGEPKVVVGLRYRYFVFCLSCGRNADPVCYWESIDDAREEWNGARRMILPGRCSCGGKPAIHLPPIFLASPHHIISCSLCEKKTPVGTGSDIDRNNYDFSPARYAVVLRAWDMLAGYDETDPGRPVSCFCGGNVGWVNAAILTIYKAGGCTSKPYSYYFCRACNHEGPRRESFFEAGVAWNKVIATKMETEDLVRPEVRPESVLNRHRVHRDAKPIGMIGLGDDGNAVFVPNEDVCSNATMVKMAVENITTLIDRSTVGLRRAQHARLEQSIMRWLASDNSNWKCTLCEKETSGPIEHLPVCRGCAHPVQ